MEIKKNIFVLNIGCYDIVLDPETNNWIFNDVLSFDNLFSQYDNIIINSHYFKMTDHMSESTKSEIVNLITNNTLKDIDWFILIINGHGRFNNGTYQFKIAECDDPSYNFISDIELLDYFDHIIGDFHKVLLINSCNAKLDGFKKKPHSTIPQEAPFPFRGQYFYNKLNRLEISGETGIIDFGLQDDIIKDKKPSQLFLIFAFTTATTTSRNDGIKSYAGSLADMVSLSNSYLSIADLSQIAVLYLTKSHQEYYPNMDVFMKNDSEKNSILQEKIPLFRINQSRRFYTYSFQKCIGFNKVIIHK